MKTITKEKTSKVLSENIFVEKFRRISEQFPSLWKRNATLFLPEKSIGDFVRVLVLFVGPILIASVMCWIMKGHFSTQLPKNMCALLVMVISAIYIGTFNSLVCVCKEKEILKYEFISGVSPTAYILSIATIQFGVCLAQAIAFSMVYTMGLEIPVIDFMPVGTGVCWFITFFLILYAADMTGLFLSCIASNGEVANVLSPVVLIFQILFSGTLWKLNSIICSFTVARWGMAGLGSLIDMGTMNINLAGSVTTQEKALIEAGLSTLGYNWEELNAFVSEQMVSSSGMDISLYESTARNLWNAWGYLALISGVLLFVNIVIVRMVVLRKRG